MKKIKIKKLDLQFDGQNHRYILNGEWVPGVSSVSGMLPKDWLAPWAAKMVVETLKELWKEGVAYTQKNIDDMLYLGKVAHTRKKTDAAEKGNNAHDWFEQRIKTGIEPPLPEDEEIQNCIEHFKDWEKRNKVEWIASEVIVGSETYKFAGTLDAIAKINGKLALADFKTSSMIGIDYYLQTGGYQIAVEEMGFKGIEERWILRFPKKKGDHYEVRKVPTSIEQDKIGFLAALNLYRYVKLAEKLNKHE